MLECVNMYSVWQKKNSAENGVILPESSGYNQNKTDLRPCMFYSWQA